jgi:hypothetical protein
MLTGRTPAIRRRQALERKVITALLKQAIAAGYTVTVDNGEEFVIKESASVRDILKVMFTVDEEWLRFSKDGKHIGTAALIYGECGWDVIADYHCVLEPIMTEANRIADELSR